VSLEADFRSFLTAIPAVAAAAPGPAGQVYPLFAPEQAVTPYLVYRRLSTARTFSHDGPVNPTTVVMRVTCWSKSYEQAVALAAAVTAAVGVPREAIAISSVQFMRPVDESDAFEPSPELLEQQYFGRQIDISLRHNE
jgi:hypothetical protein